MPSCSSHVLGVAVRLSHLICEAFDKRWESEARVRGVAWLSSNAHGVRAWLLLLEHTTARCARLAVGLCTRARDVPWLMMLARPWASLG